MFFQYVCVICLSCPMDRWKASIGNHDYGAHLKIGPELGLVNAMPQTVPKPLTQQDLNFMHWRHASSHKMCGLIMFDQPICLDLVSFGCLSLSCSHAAQPSFRNSRERAKLSLQHSSSQQCRPNRSKKSSNMFENQPDHCRWASCIFFRSKNCPRFWEKNTLCQLCQATRI